MFSWFVQMKSYPLDQRYPWFGWSRRQNVWYEVRGGGETVLISPRLVSMGPFTRVGRYVKDE